MQTDAQWAVLVPLPPPTGRGRPRRCPLEDAVEHWGVPDRFALLAQTGVLSRLREGSSTATEG